MFVRMRVKMRMMMMMMLVVRTMIIMRILNRNLWFATFSSLSHLGLLNTCSQYESISWKRSENLWNDLLNTSQEPWHLFFFILQLCITKCSCLRHLWIMQWAARRPWPRGQEDGNADNYCNNIHGIDDDGECMIVSMSSCFFRGGWWCW